MIVRLHHAGTAEHDEGRVRARVFGEEATALYPGQAWGEVEPYMAGDWRRVRGGSPLSWAQVRDDAHAAWQVAQLRTGNHLRDDAPVRLQA
jgi:hypothetical protein